MERPIYVSVVITWRNDLGEMQTELFDTQGLEEAHDLLGLMIGDISEEDLKP